MIYTVILNGHSYDLPAKTIAIAEKIDSAGSVDSRPGLSIRDKYKTVMGCVIDLIGKDATREVLGSDKLDEVDLSEVTLTFRKIVDAYNKPLAEYNATSNRSTLNELPIDQLAALANASQKIIDMSKSMPGGKGA